MTTAHLPRYIAPHGLSHYNPFCYQHDQSGSVDDQIRACRRDIDYLRHRERDCLLNVPYPGHHASIAEMKYLDDIGQQITRALDNLYAVQKAIAHQQMTQAQNQMASMNSQIQAYANAYNSPIGTTSSSMGQYVATTGGTGQYVATTGGTGASGYSGITNTSSTTTIQWVKQAVGEVMAQMAKRLYLGDTAEFELPDGAVFKLKADGSYRIDDRKAKVIYKANGQLEFNRYINASDLLEEFVEYVRALAVGRRDFLALPVELFIQWLVIRAAETDGEDAPEEKAQLAQQLALPAPNKAVPRCGCCGKFIPQRKAANGLFFCSPEHYALAELRVA